jgi:hypothetical protein
VVTKVVLLNTFAVALQVIVFLDIAATVALDTALNEFPFVGQADTPVKVLVVNCAQLVALINMNRNSTLLNTNFLLVLNNRFDIILICFFQFIHSHVVFVKQHHCTLVA